MLDTTDPTQHVIVRLARAIHEAGHYSWVSTRKVAKIMEGSETFADLISGYATLPEAHGLFAVSRSGTMVLLTERGHKWLEQHEAQTTGEGSHVAIMEEIAGAVKVYASRLTRTRVTVEGASTVARSDKRYVQALHLKTLGDDIVPTDTPVELYRRDAPTIHGRIVGQEPDGGILYVAMDTELTSYDLPATLSIDRAFLLHNLADSLERLDGLPLLAQSLLSVNTKDVPIANRNSVSVADELAALPSPWTRFLWGPPGAGKTYALGRLILQLLEREPHNRILLVAPSNLSVDVALEQLLLHLEPSRLARLLSDRQILRYGYPRKSTILAQDRLHGPEGLSVLTTEIKAFSDRITRAEREHKMEVEISVIRAELLARQEALRRMVTDHVATSRVVATTAAMTYLKASPIARMEWDTVLVDEVTMVPPAVCVFLSSLARKRFLLAGDPRQLGPIYEANSRLSDAPEKWMGRDVFDLAGVSRGDGQDRIVLTNEPRLSRVTSQRRCTTHIWKKVEHLYPGVANLVNETSLAPFHDLEPGKGKGLVMLDVGAVPAQALCHREFSSWQNEFTADLALGVALGVCSQTSASTPSIAIIAPYRAQVRLLRQRLREEQRAKTNLARQVAAGTIHQFQGSEADVVILDLVDGEGRRSLGKLLCGDTGIRLVTVAVTRARGKCIIIANRSWCRTHMRRNDNPLLYDLIVGADAVESLPVIHTMPVLGRLLP